MYLPSFKKTKHSDPEINRIQENALEKFNAYDSVPFINGNLLEIDVSTTATDFNHGLNRTPIGFLVIDKNANADIWKTGATRTTIQLDASASASIKVWVF